MIRLWVFISLIISAVYSGSVDRDTFKSCSRVEFCTTLRALQLQTEEQFTAQLENVTLEEDHVANIPLSNGNDEQLTLQITLYSQNRMRLKVLEVEHTRFEIPYVLDEEPKPINCSVVSKEEDDKLYLIPDDDYNFYVAVTSGQPFTVEFYQDSNLKVVFTSERLVMQNSNTSNPFTFDVNFPGASKLYGLSHHAFNLVLPETVDGSIDPIRLRNSDISYYEIGDTLGLYGSIPVVYAHSEKWTSGIFLHNAAEQWVDTDYTDEGASTYFMVESGTLDLFVMLGPTPQYVVREYTSLTGVAHMPQIWVLGYHQCRWSYWTQEDAMNVVANMDKNDFPMDVLWLDDGHSNQNRYFEWNPENYSDPIGFQKNISSTGRRIVTILDPHIKVADDYAVYVGAKDKYFVKWANGSDFQGDCWPGLSSWIDFLSPEASDYYGSWYSYDKFNDSTPTLAGAWNDMNEPSVFDNTLEKSMPYELVHYGGVEHRNIHNMYGFLQVKSTYNGLLARDNSTVRPFILTRSHFAGTQRYAAMWTGDNTADWPYIRLSYSECMTANILGQVLCGADVAGFFDEREQADNELTQRWYQAAIWLPFFRGHSEKTTARREPYLFDEDVQKVIRHAIKTRYRHIPVFYTLFYYHSTAGDPIIRPFFYDYPSLFEFDDHLLLGSDILARPVFESGATQVTVTLPGNSLAIWYRVDDESWNFYNANSTLDIPVDITVSPFFYRGGSIVTLKDRARRSTTDMVDDPYTIYVNVDTDSRATGHLYVDDFYSFDYINKNSYLLVEMTYIPESHGLSFTQLGRWDSSNIPVFFQKIVIHTPDSENPGIPKKSVHTTTIDGTPLESIDIAKHLRQRSKFILHL